jgi:protein-L-isoaspartate(D-aspartate) O-methyltransferase
MNEIRNLDLRTRAVERLVRKGYVRTEAVRHALLSVDRSAFTNFAPERAYEDRPLPIGFGQTVSAMHMVAIYLESLELRGGIKLLEIGTGSGYHLAVTASALDFLGAGEIHTIEINETLYRKSKQLVEGMGFKTRIYFHLGDGFLGVAESAPFDRIYVTASVAEKPAHLYEQLSEEGILLYPRGVQGEPQILVKVRKAKTDYLEEGLMEVSFVQLRRPGERFI